MIDSIKNNLIKFFALFAVAFLYPMSTFAATTSCATDNIGGVICKIKEILGSILPLLISFAVIFMVWGILRYMIADSEEAKTKGKDQVIYGVIGLVVIIGMWGLVSIIVTTFNLESAAPSLEPLKIQGSGDCTLGSDAKLQNLLCYVTKIINDSIIPLIFAIATLFFVWGAVKFFIINADEEAQREQGKQFMIWSIIALTVMLSVWSLVAILGGTFGFEGKFLPQVIPPSAG